MAFDEKDDWLFDSMNMYKNLSMYDMQHCVTAMDLVGGKSLCMATENQQRSQILELVLPDKMLDSGQAAVEKLKKDRDFRLRSGGFCDNAVTEIVHISQTRHCVLSEKDGGVGVWEMGSESSDLIQKVQSLPPVTEDSAQVCMATYASTDRRVFYGSRLNNLTLVDCETGSNLLDIAAFTASDPVSSLCFLSADSILTCSTNGTLHMVDLRSKEVKVTDSCNHGDGNSFWTMSKPGTQSNCFFKLSSVGDVQMTDARNLKQPVSKGSIEVTGKAVRKYLTIQQNSEGDRFSVSGLGGLVHIYRLTDLTSNIDNIKPVFTHEGHVTCCDGDPDKLQVVKHLWHPWVQGLIISTATDCSLHAWQYNT